MHCMHTLRSKKYALDTRFLPQASFELWVLSLPASVCPYVCVSVRYSVCQPSACPRDNLWCSQARITKLVSEVQNTLIKIPIVLVAIELDLQRQIWLKNPNWPHFELVRTITHHLFKLGSPNLNPQMQNTSIKLPIVWGVDWCWSSHQFCKLFVYQSICTVFV